MRIDFPKWRKKNLIHSLLDTPAELLKEFLDSYGPENFFSATLDPKIKFAMNKEVPLVLLAASRRTGAAPSANIAALRKPYIQVNEKFNQDIFWKEFIPRLHKPLEGVAVKKTKVFYSDGVRKANQRLPKEGFFLRRGIVYVYDGQKGMIRYRDAKTNRDVEAYLPYYANVNGNDKIYRLVVPHDNASYTIYDMPFRGMKGNRKYLRDFYANNYNVPVDDSINEEGAAMLLAFIQFTQRMCRPVDYSVSYLDKSEEVMTIQIIRTGPRAFGVYRSFDRSQYWRGDTLIFAPGFVNGNDENPVYGINSERKYNLFLGTGNYNKAHPEAGYEVELDTEELKRLGSMKFEIVYENQ